MGGLRRRPSRRRADLARSLRRLAEMRYPLQRASDHTVSEALYLADSDGNGIEIYADLRAAEAFYVWVRPHARRKSPPPASR